MFLWINCNDKEETNWLISNFVFIICYTFVELAPIPQLNEDVSDNESD
jgi:hypothetical protein